VWPAGSCAEVHHLGYDPPLQRPGALQQGSGTWTGRATDVHCLIVTHTALTGRSNSFLVILFSPFVFVGECHLISVKCICHSTYGISCTMSPGFLKLSNTKPE